MPSIKDEPLEAVLGSYGIEVTGIRNESYKDKKGVWWINTPAGFKILKKISSSEETLKFILDAARHLSKNGINIPQTLKTRDERDYAIVGNVPYVLSDAIIGKNPDYASDLTKIITELARFHKASAGFIPAPGSKPKIHLGTWLKEYERQVEEMNSYYSDAEFIRLSGAVGTLIAYEFPYFYERAKKAVERLKEPEYTLWNEKAGGAGCLCHQDFAAGNLISDPSGRIFVIDIDSLTIDIPARDIRKIINKIMKKHGKWDIELAARIINLYQRENPLSAPEWRVVETDLMFPHLFMGAMNKFCYKRDKEWSDAKYLDRIREVSAFERTFSNVSGRLEQFGKSNHVQHGA